MAVDGVGGVLVSEEKALEKLAADHESNAVLSLEWGADPNEELRRDLMNAIGAMFRVESILDESGDRKIEPTKSDPAQLVASAVSRLRSQKLNLWLDHGIRGTVEPAPPGGFPRYHSDHKHYFEFRVLPEGKIVERPRKTVEQ